MKDSIIVDMKYAVFDLVDGTPCVERHHVFGGSNRSKSDEDGLWVPLTKAHHTGKMSVHMNHEMNVMCHIIGQLAYEKHIVAEGYTEEEAREKFRDRYGKSYL